jgi:hypothetical protein
MILTLSKPFICDAFDDSRQFISLTLLTNKTRPTYEDDSFCPSRPIGQARPQSKTMAKTFYAVVMKTAGRI